MKKILFIIPTLGGAIYQLVCRSARKKYGIKVIYTAHGKKGKYREFGVASMFWKEFYVRHIRSLCRTHKAIDFL